MQRARLGDTAAATQLSVFELATVLHAAGRLREADPLFGEWERVAAGRPHTRDEVRAEQLDQLGEYLASRGRFQQDTAAMTRAERHFREALSIRREIHGPRHVEVAFGARDVGWVTWMRGNATEGEALFREALATLRAVYPDGHPDLALTLSDFASHLSRAGRHAEALPIMREAVTVARRYHGEGNLLMASYLHRYGEALDRAGDHAAAERALRESAVLMARHAGDRSLMTVRARVALAGARRVRVRRHGDLTPRVSEGGTAFRTY